MHLFPFGAWALKGSSTERARAEVDVPRGAHHGAHIQLLGDLGHVLRCSLIKLKRRRGDPRLITISLCEALATCLMSADELRTKAGPYGYVPGACRSNAVAFGASVE